LAETITATLQYEPIGRMSLGLKDLARDLHAVFSAPSRRRRRVIQEAKTK
jgi:hypothetical protein